MVERLREELKINKGKISFDFIQREVAEHTEDVWYFHLTANMRACVIKLKSGHEVLGMAQVLDSKNDVEEIGNKVAFDNAVNKLWEVYGSIAKVIGEI